MKLSSGQRGTDRRVWVHFLQFYPAAVEAGGKWKSGGVCLISKRTGKVCSLGLFQPASFPPPAALRRARASCSWLVGQRGER